MMNVKNTSKRIVIISFVIAAALCLTGFAMASVMNATGEDTDTIRDSDVMQESTANPQDEKSSVSESNTPNDSNIGGKYLWPLTEYNRISAAYGTRMHPVEKTMVFHDGIDIPAPGGTPILAANTGKVFLCQVGTKKI